MKTHFVILAGPRSGSTAFRLWLNSHPLIRCHDEVLLKRLESADAITTFYHDRGCIFFFDSQALPFPNNPETSQLLIDFINSLYFNRQHPAPWGHLDAIPERSIIENYDSEQAIGFKFMYYLLDNQSLGSWLSSGNVRIIHLVRDNLLKQYLSYLTFRESGLAHSEVTVSPTRLTVDTGTLLQTLSSLSNKRQLILQRFKGDYCLQVSYESFCDEPEDLARRITTFLDVDPASMGAPSLKKINPEYLPSLIKNYDDVARCLDGTPYQSMLG